MTNDKNQAFFREAVGRIQKIAPGVLEIWVHGGRAIGDANGAEECGFIGFLPPPLATSRRLQLAAMGKKAGFASLMFAAAQKVDVQPAHRATHKPHRHVGVAYFARIEGDGFKVWSAVDGMICLTRLGQTEPATPGSDNVLQFPASRRFA